MEKEISKNIKWDDYLVIGTAVVILMTILGYSGKTLYYLIPFCVFFVITGLMDNVNVLFGFIKKHWVFCTVFSICILFYLFTEKSTELIRILVVPFFEFTAGYCMAARCEERYEQGYRKLWVLLLALILLGISKMWIDNQIGYFMSYSEELGIAIIFAAITFMHQEKIKLKALGGIISAVDIVILLRSDAINIDSVTNSVQHVGERNGYIALLLYFVIFVCSILICFKTIDRSIKKQAILVCVMMIAALLFSLEDFDCILFLLSTGIGLLLGGHEYGTVGEIE